MSILFRYKNGNYWVLIYSDGTKVRLTGGSGFRPEFPESIDLKITNRCDMGCPFCHEQSAPDGNHGTILGLPFYDTLRAGMELAIGGGNPLSHPDFETFLQEMKARGIICNLTVNWKHVDPNYLDRLHEGGLIHGLGISVHGYYQDAVEFAWLRPHVVLHVVNGIIPIGDLLAMADPKVKVLILGYKSVGRGKSFEDPQVVTHREWMYYRFLDVFHSFEVISFDNLAIEQLQPQRFLDKGDWDRCYMGDDGQFTMYIDLVKREFGISSTDQTRHPLLDDIRKMFAVARGAVAKET